MKRTILSLLLCLCGMSAVAQSPTAIQFNLLKCTDSSLSDEVTEALHVKLKQVLNRNSAAAADVYNVFAIEPHITLTDVLTSEGTVRSVTMAKGELVLFAKNSVDGAEYYYVSVPVEAVVNGNKDKAVLSLVNGIKVTNPAFTRFIRVARQKIADYYAENCATIMQKAKALYNQKRYEEAVCYLSGASANMPCFDQAYELQRQILENLGVPAPMPIDDPVELPDDAPVPQPVVEPAPQPVVEPVAQPVSKPLNYDLTISKPGLAFKVLSCVGDATLKRITITAEIVNQGAYGNSSNEWCKTMLAYDDNGTELKELMIADDKYSTTRPFPKNLKVKEQFHILGLDNAFDTLSYVKIGLGDVVVELKNLAVQWK